MVNYRSAASYPLLGEQPPWRAALADLVPILPHGRATRADLSKVMANLLTGPYRARTTEVPRPAAPPPDVDLPMGV
jgi:hypothetical protein